MRKKPWCTPTTTLGKSLADVSLSLIEHCVNVLLELFLEVLLSCVVIEPVEDIAHVLLLRLDDYLLFIVQVDREQWLNSFCLMINGVSLPVLRASFARTFSIIKGGRHRSKASMMDQLLIPMSVGNVFNRALLILGGVALGDDNRHRADMLLVIVFNFCFIMETCPWWKDSHDCSRLLCSVVGDCKIRNASISGWGGAILAGSTLIVNGTQVSILRDNLSLRCIPIESIFGHQWLSCEVGAPVSNFSMDSLFRRWLLITFYLIWGETKVGEVTLEVVYLWLHRQLTTIKYLLRGSGPHFFEQSRWG